MNMALWRMKIMKTRCLYNRHQHGFFGHWKLESRHRRNCASFLAVTLTLSNLNPNQSTLQKIFGKNNHSVGNCSRTRAGKNLGFLKKNLGF